MTTDQPPAPIVAAALRHAAALIGQRHYNLFRGGAELWGVLHLAATDMIAEPAGEYLRKHLGERQLQHWAGTQQEAATVLRAAADAAPPLADAQADAALADMEAARDALRLALAYDGWCNDEPLSVLADQVGHKTRLRISLIAELEKERDRLRARLDDAEAELARKDRETRVLKEAARGDARHIHEIEADNLRLGLLLIGLTEAS